MSAVNTANAARVLMDIKKPSLDYSLLYQSKSKLPTYSMGISAFHRPFDGVLPGFEQRGLPLPDNRRILLPPKPLISVQ
jgi:hypothetical protein